MDAVALLYDQRNAEQILSTAWFGSALFTLQFAQELLNDRQSDET